MSDADREERDAVMDLLRTERERRQAAEEELARVRAELDGERAASLILQGDLEATVSEIVALRERSERLIGLVEQWARVVRPWHSG